MSDIRDVERMVEVEFLNTDPTYLKQWAQRLCVRESILNRELDGIENSKRILEDSQLALSEGWVQLKGEQQAVENAKKRVRGEEITACVVVAFALLILFVLVLQSMRRLDAITPTAWRQARAVVTVESR